MTKHFILLDKDYVISPEFKRPQRRRGITLGLMTLYILRKYRKTKNGSKGGGPKSGSVARGIRIPDRRQKCTVKMQYSRSFSAHKEQLQKYLVREGTGKNGNKTELYGTDIDEYKKNMVNKNFRIFLSPANSRVPLESLAKTFVKHLELQTGYRFYWMAAEHYNTDHPHVHLLINGKDKNGKDVFIPRDVVKTLMRESARNICTSLVGSRTRSDMEAEKNQTVNANRYTYLDARISEHAVDNTVFLSMITQEKEPVNARLEHLRTMGLCSWDSGHYVLTPGWEDILRVQGRYNMFLDARKSLRFTSSDDISLYDGRKGVKYGVITRMYKPDELSNQHAIVLEAVDGKAYFIPLFKKPNVGMGDMISIEPRKNEKGRLTPVIRKESAESLIKEGSSRKTESYLVRHIKIHKNKGSLLEK